jgi:hypothetical protein
MSNLCQASVVVHDLSQSAELQTCQSQTGERTGLWLFGSWGLDRCRGGFISQGRRPSMRPRGDPQKRTGQAAMVQR